MIKEIKQKLRKKYNTKQNIIDSLKEENRSLLKRIDQKNELILSLFELRDEQQRKIKELLEENEKSRSKKEWINERFITCKYCGYNNFKKRLESFGTCLRCGKIIDEKSYFKKKLGGKDLWLEKTKLRMKLKQKSTKNIKK